VQDYPYIKDKLALLVESACLAKTLLVDSEGIGEDLPSTLVGWNANRINVLAQSTSDIRNNSFEDRYNRLEEVGAYIARGWNPSEITFISEGYANISDTIEERALSEAFITNPNIVECLTFVHISSDLTPIAIAVPYKCGLGRTTTYDTPARAYAQDFANQWGPLTKAMNTNQHNRLSEHEATTAISHLGWTIGKDNWT